MDPLFLSLDEVVEIHRIQIEHHGGSYGIRDLGLLQSAIAMRQKTDFDEYALEKLVLNVVSGKNNKEDVAQFLSS